MSGDRAIRYDSVGLLYKIERNDFFHHGAIPCRRTIRLDISTPTMSLNVSFQYSRTLLMVATHKEHRRSRSTRDSQTSTTKNCTPERHFYPTIVSRVDQKWLSGRMKAHSVRLTPVASGMIDGTGRIGPEHSRSAANIKIHVFWRPQRHARCKNNKQFLLLIKTDGRRVYSTPIQTRMPSGLL